MTWLTYGNQLHTYIGTDIPREYGGSSASLKERGLTPKYDDEAKSTNGDAARETKAESTSDAGGEIADDTKTEV